MGASRCRESHCREASPQLRASITHLSARLCEVHFAFPANPLFPFLAMSRGNAISSDEMPALSSLAGPLEHSRGGRVSAFPVGRRWQDAGKQALTHGQPCRPEISTAPVHP